jgi:hypothetical protein
MNIPIAPPDQVVKLALEVASRSPCRSKRGEVLYDPRGEFKEDSYVMTRGRGAVLVEASSALRVGRELVRYTQDVLVARRPLTERLEDIAFAIRQERRGSIPATVADKLLTKFRARGVDT